MNPSNLILFYEPAERLRLTIPDDRSYITVKPAWSAPITHPGRYLALLDGNNEEILLVSNPSDLPPESKAVVERELRQRYLTATVTVVLHAKQEYGATYWTVETDRGPREFVTQSLQENALWFSDKHLLLLDVDGNRFEIPDITALDTRSRTVVEGIL